MTVHPSWMPDASMQRVVGHWTAGSYNASALDRKHYHILVQGDATLVQGVNSIAANAAPIRGGYAAHTLNCNSGSIGISMCAMAGAVEMPFDPGKYPIREEQWRVFVQANADLCKRYRIPVTDKTVLTHAEVQDNLGIQQRGKWDIARLPFDSTVWGPRAVGDKLRREVQAAMQDDSLPAPPDVPKPEPVKVTRLLKRGARGEDVRAMQEVLGVVADGIFGPKTEAAVRAYQDRHGLTVDGLAGPQTLGAMGLA